MINFLSCDITLQGTDKFRVLNDSKLNDFSFDNCLLALVQRTHKARMILRSILSCPMSKDDTGIHCCIDEGNTQVPGPQVFAALISSLAITRIDFIDGKHFLFLLQLVTGMQQQYVVATWIQPLRYTGLADRPSKGVLVPFTRLHRRCHSN